MIEEWVQRAFAEFMRLLTAAGHDAWAHTLGLLDPFWGYALYGAAILAMCFIVIKFFVVLRPVAGAVAFATIAFLVGFWKGESSEQMRARAKQKGKSHGH